MPRAKSTDSNIGEIFTLGVYVLTLKINDDIVQTVTPQLMPISWNPLLLVASIKKTDPLATSISKDQTIWINVLMAGERTTVESLLESRPKLPDDVEVHQDNNTVLSKSVLALECSVIEITEQGDSLPIILRSNRHFMPSQGQPLTLRQSGLASHFY